MPDTTTVVAATIQINAGNSNANIKEVNQNLGDVRASLQDTGASALSTGASMESAGGSFGKLKDQMSALPGPLGEASDGVGKLSDTFKALLANPVVLIIAAIVAALALLYKAFTNSFEGGEKMEQVFAGIKAAAQALFDNLGHIASAIVKFFELDFSGAIAEIKGVAAAAADAYGKMAKLTQQAQDLSREQATNSVEQAKREAKLADLRAKAYDESVPIAARKAALLELQKESEEAAKYDIDLAKRVTQNKIDQLLIQDDGARKNFVAIAGLQADQIKAETAASTELKSIGRAVTQAQKQEIADRKAAHEKEVADAKARREELVDYTNKLAKIQQDTTLATLNDGYVKEKQLLENKIADDKRTNDVAFQEGKITQQQYQTLNLALEAQAQAQRDTLEDKHNKDVATKEAAFQKDLQGILSKIKEDGQVSAEAVEKAKLQADYAQRLADAEKTYADDAMKFKAIKDALDQELRADEDKLRAKYELEKEQKQLKVEQEHLKTIINNQKAAASLRLAAVTQEQALLKKNFDNKVITEVDYNTQVDQLAKDRQTIRDQEAKDTERTASAIGTTLGNLSNLVGKQTVVGKAFAIAQTTMDTYSSAIKAYNSMADIPVVGPVLGAVAAAAAIANGLEAVKNIAAVQVPGQGAGGSAPSIGLTPAAAPVAPTQASTSLNQGSINAMGAQTGRVYVLSGDVANNADRDARLNRAARLGGS